MTSLVVTAALTLLLAASTCAVMTYTVEEEQEAGAFVADIRQDSDLRSKYNATVFDSLRFRLRYTDAIHNLFSIDTNSGVLTTAQVIDREQVCANVNPCHLDIDVRATQPSGGLDLVKFVVEVTDINDHLPTFAQASISREISESTVQGVQFPLPSADDPDAGANGVRSYQLVSEDENDDVSAFRLVTSQNADGSIDVNLALAQSLDRETRDEYHFRLIASDGGNPARSGSMRVDVTVLDANDNSPVFDRPTYNVTVDENVAPETVILQVRVLSVRVC